MRELSECRVLIVDDARTNVDILVEALRGDHRLSVALDGEAALRLAEKSAPDLILLDIIMPGIDGYEVCRRLRASPKTNEIPVMFLSSLEDVANKARGFEVGGNDYLTKPFDVIEVKARVRSLLKAKAYSDAVKEKIASELRIAREIQLGILPSDIRSTTRGSGLAIEAVLEPAREVGGDLYEVLRTEDGRIVTALGDVSGKGIPAALFMAVTTTLIRTLARQFRGPDEIIRQVSEALVLHNPRGLFVTLFCAIYDPRTGLLTCASAGHPPPVLLSPGKPPALTLEPTGGLAGLEPGLALTTRTTPLEPGEMLLLYTDGVTEAFNARDEAFGEEGLLSHLAASSGRPAGEAVSGLLAAVRGFAGDHPQSDDIAIVALRREPGR